MHKTVKSQGGERELKISLLCILPDMKKQTKEKQQKTKKQRGENESTISNSTL